MAQAVTTSSRSNTPPPPSLPRLSFRQTYPLAELVEDVVVPFVALLVHEAALLEQKRQRSGAPKPPVSAVLELDVLAWRKKKRERRDSLFRIAHSHHNHPSLVHNKSGVHLMGHAESIWFVYRLYPKNYAFCSFVKQ